MARNVVVTGGRALVRKLRSLPRSVRRNVVEGALKAGAGAIEAAAKEFAPVRTGALREAIHVRELKNRSPWSVSFEVAVGEGDLPGDRFYGAFVEFGTSTIVAHPFMRPALDVAGPRARAVMAKRIWLGIETEARK